MRPLLPFNNIFSSKSALYDVIKGCETSPRLARTALGIQVFFVVFKSDLKQRGRLVFVSSQTSGGSKQSTSVGRKFTLNCSSERVQNTRRGRSMDLIDECII